MPEINILKFIFIRVLILPEYRCEKVTFYNINIPFTTTTYVHGSITCNQTMEVLHVQVLQNSLQSEARYCGTVERKLM